MGRLKAGIISVIAVSLCVGVFTDTVVGSGWEIDLGDYPWPEDWIWLDLIVNIANDTPVNKLELATAIAHAQAILQRAGIHTNVRDVNDSASYGDNDPSLTERECREAQDHGERELDRICGPGKGLKITIADINDPRIPADVLGLAEHGHPVVFIEPDPNCTDPNNPDPNDLSDWDPNNTTEWGKTIAHELCHSLTIEHDLYDGNDPNNLMWWQEGSGTELDPNQMEEIRGRALARGMRYPLEGWNWWRPTDPWGFGFWTLDADGAGLDDAGDAVTSDGDVPGNESYVFADLRAASAFCEGVGGTEAVATFEIRLGGEYPQEVPFTATYEINIAGLGSGDISDSGILLQITVESKAGELQAWGLAQNFLSGETYDLAVRVASNKLLGCPGGYEAAGNSSIHTSVPASVLWQDSKAATMPMQVFVSSRTSIFPSEDMTISGPVLYDSLPGPFEFGIGNPADCPSVAFGCLGPMCDNRAHGTDQNVDGEWPSDTEGVDLIGIFGNCFDTDTIVRIDGAEVGSAAIDDDGRCVFWLDPKTLSKGHHTVVMQEAMSGPKGRRSAAGFLSTTLPMPGDLNADFEVDFRDVAIMADFWLSGK